MESAEKSMSSKKYWRKNKILFCTEILEQNIPENATPLHHVVPEMVFCWFWGQNIPENASPKFK